MERSPLGTTRLRIAAMAGVLTIGLPVAAGADGGGAETSACLEESGAVRACSNKELSNVVLQCSDGSGSYFVKYDELDEGSYEGLITPYEGNFSCPQGDVIAVFIKSGRNTYGGQAIEGLPPGSGALWSPLACGAEESSCESAEGGGGDEGGGEGGGGDEGGATENAG